MLFSISFFFFSIILNYVLLHFHFTIRISQREFNIKFILFANIKKKKITEAVCESNPLYMRPNLSLRHSIPRVAHLETNLARKPFSFKEKLLEYKI